MNAETNATLPPGTSPRSSETCARSGRVMSFREGGRSGEVGPQGSECDDRRRFVTVPTVGIGFADNAAHGSQDKSGRPRVVIGPSRWLLLNS